MQLSRLRLDVGGVSIDVVASADHLRFVTDRVGTLESTAEAPVTMTLTRSAPHLPCRPPDQVFEDVRVWFDDAVIWMQNGNAVSVVSEGKVEIGGEIGTAVDRRSIEIIMQFSVAAAVATPSRLMVHGAVVGRSDSALLIVGKSGAGKSTAAAAAFVNGWDLLTDDLAVVQPTERVIQGVARLPRFPANIAARCGIDGVMESNKRGRMILGAESLSHGPRRLAGLIAVGHGDEGQLETLEPGDLSVIDSAMAVPLIKPLVRRQLGVVAALASIPSFRLSHAADDHVRLDRAAEMLEEALRLCQ